MVGAQAGGCRYFDVVSGAGGVGVRSFLQHVWLSISFYGILSSFCIPYHGMSPGTKANACSYAFILLLRMSWVPAALPG